jgi:hypothetical protein
VIAYLATTNRRWRKVAMVFVRVAEALGVEFPEGQTGHEMFGRRIETLVRDGRLAAQGGITLMPRKNFDENLWPMKHPGKSARLAFVKSTMAGERTGAAQDTCA